LVNKLINICIISFLLFSCQKPVSSKLRDPDFSMVENGDIIYRHGNGFFSSYFKNTSSKEQIYSHTGIINVSADTIFVIHSEASEFTGIGGVKKEPLNIFLKDIATWAVYRVDTVQSVRDSIAILALEYKIRDIPFDFYFDNSSDDKIYCTELVALVVNKAMHRNLIIPTGVFNNKPYYAIDDTYLVEKINPVLKNKGDH